MELPAGMHSAIHTQFPGYFAALPDSPGFAFYTWSKLIILLEEFNGETLQVNGAQYNKIRKKKNFMISFLRYYVLMCK